MTQIPTNFDAQWLLRDAAQRATEELSLQQAKSMLLRAFTRHANDQSVTALNQFLQNLAPYLVGHLNVLDVELSGKNIRAAFANVLDPFAIAAIVKPITDDDAVCDIPSGPDGDIGTGEESAEEKPDAEFDARLARLLARMHEEAAKTNYLKRAMAAALRDTLPTQTTGADDDATIDVGREHFAKLLKGTVTAAGFDADTLDTAAWESMTTLLLNKHVKTAFYLSIALGTDDDDALSMKGPS